MCVANLGPRRLPLCAPLTPPGISSVSRSSLLRSLCAEANLAPALMRSPAGPRFSYPNAGISRLLFSKAHLIVLCLFLSACHLLDPWQRWRGLNDSTTTALLSCFCVAVVSRGARAFVGLVFTRAFWGYVSVGSGMWRRSARDERK